MNNWRAEWELLVIATGFLSRLPVPEVREFTEQKLNHAGRYFPLVGALIGLLCATAFWLTTLAFSNLVAAVVCVITGLVVTGAFHEDGLADTLDGFGGGLDRERKLTIMKDSRIGTYGAVALWSALSLKVLLIADLPQPVIGIIIVHLLSRAVATSLIFDLPYVRDIDSSKVKPLAENLSSRDKLTILVTSAIALVFVLPVAIYLVIAMLVVRQACAVWFKRQIGGFTGDCLGASQQIAEIVLFAVLILFT